MAHKQNAPRASVAPSITTSRILEVSWPQLPCPRRDCGGESAWKATPSHRQATPSAAVCGRSFQAPATPAAAHDQRCPIKMVLTQPLECLGPVDRFTFLLFLLAFLARLALNLILDHLIKRPLLQKGICIMKMMRLMGVSQGVLFCLCLTVARSSFAQGSTSPTTTNTTIPVVTITATDPFATWSGNPGVFTLYRAGNPEPTLNVYYQIAGTAPPRA